MGVMKRKVREKLGRTVRSLKDILTTTVHEARLPWYKHPGKTATTTSARTTTNNSRRDYRDYFTGTDYYHYDSYFGEEIHAPPAATHGDLHIHSDGYSCRIRTRMADLQPRQPGDRLRLAHARRSHGSLATP